MKLDLTGNLPDHQKLGDFSLDVSLDVVCADVYVENVHHDLSK